MWMAKRWIKLIYMIRWSRIIYFLKTKIKGCQTKGSIYRKTIIRFPSLMALDMKV